ncbi:MAG: macro domain-containing protein [Candidatus Diapherotrites archaeon]|nr:macro domain-containing protein [Candidatus Diapherotrites archaeon]
MFSIKKGDLFNAFPEVDTIGHGCNCFGTMSAGIALEFEKFYPENFQIYKDLCMKKEFKLGSVLFYQSKDKRKPNVLNLGTQFLPGKDAKLELIEKCCDKILLHYQMWGVKKLGMPKIGAGIGGLEWEDVEKLLRKKFENEKELEVIVYVRD